MSAYGTIHRSVGVTYVESPTLIGADQSRKLYSAAVLMLAKCRRDGDTYSDEFCRLKSAIRDAEGR